MNTKKLVLAALGTIVLAGHAAAGMAQPGPFGQSPAPLEGSWIVTVRPIACSTGADLPVPPVTSYITFGRGGTLLEVTSPTFFEPGQRSPGHGTWYRTGNTSYQFYLQAFIQFDSTLTTRYKRGYQRIDQTLEMHADDEWTSTGNVGFFAGTSVTDPYIGPGCARNTGTRMY